MNSRHDYLLSKYFNIDKAKKIAYINLYYNLASDILDLSISTNDYIIKDEIINDINDLIKMIPNKYKINININIKDYETYDKDKLLESFNDTIEMNYYQRDKLVKYRNLKVGFLVVIGILLLSVMVYFKASNIVSSESISYGIISEVIDISAWVFIWEAVTVAFLSGIDLPFNSRFILVRVKNINLVDDNSNIISSLNVKEEAYKWDYTSRIKKLVNMIYLFTGIVFFGLGVEGFVKFIDPTYREVLIKDPTLFGTQIILSIFELLAGLGISLRYLGVEKKTFKIAIFIFNIIIVFEILVSTAGIIFFYNLGEEYKEYADSLSNALFQGQLFYIITVFLYLISVVLEFIFKKHEIKLEVKEKEFNNRLNQILDEDSDIANVYKKKLETKKEKLKNIEHKNTWRH